jgi:3-isopropylmalate/(R)-2-methylmalate dehydratase small subunit
MEPLTIHRGLVMPLDRANVDTDAIIPASYLKAVTRTGFAQGLFTNWRYLDESGQADPAFVLNMPRYRDATVLLARENFGCGSSREHAPWALYEYGFRVLIAPSFADIFYNNCFSVGILPMHLPDIVVQSLFTEVETTTSYTLTIDLQTQSITTPAALTYPFEIAPFRRETLLHGLDAIAHTLQFEPDITSFEARQNTVMPWYDVAAQQGSR